MSTNIVTTKTKKIGSLNSAQPTYRIVSSENYIICYLKDNSLVEWRKGSKTAHMYNDLGRIIDTLPIGVDKETPHMLDYIEAIQERLFSEERKN